MIKQENRLVNFWSRLSRIEKWFLVVAAVLTVVRVLMAMKIPLHIQAGAAYDDRLFVNYADNMLFGRWLGPFDQFSLAKGVSYSLLLVINYLIGLPYSFTLVSLYLVAVALFCVALYKILKCKTFMYILYSVMIYSPVMFHDENVQKIYRGGAITIFALLVVAGIIGMYTRVEEQKRRIIGWAVLTTAVLPFFWFLKEDSIWILPFVVGGLGLAVVRIWRTKKPRSEKWWRSALVVMPLIGLLFGITCYKTINYVKYGEFAITDRQGTYFSNVISDLIRIDGEGRSKDNWVTKDMLRKAFEVSPTLAQSEDEIRTEYKKWAKSDGEVEGDIVFWAIKDAVAKAGFYESGQGVNSYYESVDRELNEAFKDGRLERNRDFYVSSVAKGINIEELPEFVRHVGESLNNVISYGYNETGVYEASGDTAGIAMFNALTMSQYVEPGVDIGLYRVEGKVAKIANGVTKIYQIVGGVLFYLMLIIVLGYTGRIIYCAFRKRVSRNELRVYLVLMGLIVTCMALLLGTAFFCRFLSQRKVYDYVSPMLPMLLAAEMISLYVVIEKIRARKYGIIG